MENNITIWKIFNGIGIPRRVASLSHPQFIFNIKPSYYGTNTFLYNTGINSRINVYLFYMFHYYFYVLCVVYMVRYRRNVLFSVKLLAVEYQQRRNCNGVSKGVWMLVLGMRLNGGDDCKSSSSRSWNRTGHTNCLRYRMVHDRKKERIRTKMENWKRWNEMDCIKMGDTTHPMLWFPFSFSYSVPTTLQQHHPPTSHPYGFIS